MQNNIDNIELGFVKRGTKDNNNLTDEFNYRLRKLYTSLLVFYDEETARNIYSNGYYYMLYTLDTALEHNVDQEVFHIMISGGTSEAIKDSVLASDPFKDGLLLSKGNFSELSKDIIKLSLPDIITENYITYEFHRDKTKRQICEKYKINSLEFYIENYKALHKLKKIIKKGKKGVKKELTIK